MKAGLTLLLLSIASSVACNNPQTVVDDISRSHVEGNVPSGKLFDEYLTQDLSTYFCRAKDCKVEYELLRDGPTQSGVSYPKYYIWVKTFKGSVFSEEGAVRVAAVDQRRFVVTHFLSQEEILKSPSEVASIFPPALANTIIERARRSRN